MMRCSRVLSSIGSLALLFASGARADEYGAMGTLAVGFDGGGWAAFGQTSGNGNGGISMTWYGQRLADDGAPLSMQPFLQRASLVEVFASGGAFSTSVPGASRNYTGVGLSAGAAVGHYLNNMFGLTASASLQRSSTTGPGFFSEPDYVTPSLSVGTTLRFGDTAIGLSGRYAPVFADGTLLHTRTATMFGLSVESALARVISLELDTRTLPSGGSAAGSITFHYTPRLGFSGSLAFARGQIFVDSTTIFWQLAPHVDVSYWLTSRVRVLAGYTHVHTEGDSPFQTTDEHHANLSLSWRIE
jgi:hypothetical protein